MSAGGLARLLFMLKEYQDLKEAVRERARLHEAVARWNEEMRVAAHENPSRVVIVSNARGRKILLGIRLGEIDDQGRETVLTTWRPGIFGIVPVPGWQAVGPEGPLDIGRLRFVCPLPKSEW